MSSSRDLGRKEVSIVDRKNILLEGEKNIKKKVFTSMPGVEGEMGCFFIFKVTFSKDFSFLRFVLEKFGHLLFILKI